MNANLKKEEQDQDMLQILVTVQQIAVEQIENHEDDAEEVEDIDRELPGATNAAIQTNRHRRRKVVDVLFVFSVVP